MDDFVFKFIEQIFGGKVPWQTISLSLIIGGTVAGAIGTFKDNKTIQSLLNENRELTKEGVDLSKEIKNVSESLAEISKENSDILENNAKINSNVESLANEIKGLSKKTQLISENTNVLATNINNNSEAIKFFNSKNYSYLREYFPIGFIVKRQNESGNHFIKSYGYTLDYESFDIEISRLSGKRLKYNLKNNVFLEKNKVIFKTLSAEGGVQGEIDEDYNTIWKLLNLETIEGYVLGLFLINDGHEFTYAVGQVPIGLLPEKD